MNKISVLTLAGCLVSGAMIGMSFSSTTLAATIYVDATNNSSIEDGTQTNPYNTIQEGIDATTRDLEPMDVVSVSPGIYIGQIVWKSGVILQSQQGPELTIIDGNGSSSVFVPPPRPADLISGSPRGFINGFTIRNNGAGTLLPVYSRYAPYQTGTLNVDNCVLEDAQYGVSGSFFSQLTMNTTVLRNLGTAVTGALAFDQLNNVTIDGVNQGIRLFGSNLITYNTTVSNVAGNGMEIGCNFYGCGSVTGSHLNLWNAPLVLHSNSRGQKPYYTVTDQLSVDPLFVNPPSDHRLQSDSPLIDAGIDVGLPFLGEAPDIGAYDFGYSIPEMVENLVEVIQEIPPEAFPNAAEQRQNALTNKLEAVLEKLDSITETTPVSEQIDILNAALNKLKKDILAKTDGFFGGNPKNDWIETLEGQELVYPMVLELIEAVQAELDVLMTIS